MCFGNRKPKELEDILADILTIRGVETAEIEKLHDEHCHIEVLISEDRPKGLIIKNLEKVAGNITRYIR
jgi:hypothetical protein